MRTRFIFIVILLLGIISAAYSQTDKALLRDLARENQKSIEALALYPEDARLAILEAAKYPEVLIKMQSIREKTSAAFRTLIEDYPRNTQAIFYDLTRYPGLVADLAARQGNRDALRQTLDVLPGDKQSEALGVVERQAGTMSKINDLNRTAQGAYDNLIAGYPAPAQQAFRTLLGLPEVVDILNEDLRFTILVGDVYREDPAWAIRKMDSLNLAVARTHAAEQEEWKKNIENDPQAQQELQAAANEYATEYGYTDEIYDIVNDDLYAAPGSAPTRVVYQYQYAYPYWFGYPWWSPQPWWRPYPYWWYWGFYPYQSTIVIIHMPSYHFMHWYFYHPYHHHHYNRLSTHFVNHYYGHRNSGTNISAGVGEWRNHNRTIISDDWLSDKGRVPERLKEYARFEQGRQAFNDKNPTRALTSEQYLEKNARQYPELVRSRTAATTEIQRERANENQRRSDWAPPKEPVKPEADPARVPRADQKNQPERPPRVLPTDKPKTQPTQPAPRPERPAQQPAKKPIIDDARDYHRDKWQEPKRPIIQPQQQPARMPQTQPAPRKTTPQQTPKTQKSRSGG
ncbi:MAG: hypothetical protein IPM98_18330 [Lewinellaceae bacterium]|nr:hypothetical protein [Lewinellaceae bacterium]